MRNKKRILSVTIKRIIDSSPDTSYLGEYSNTQDYERMESLNAGNWCYIGIRAEAKVSVYHPQEVRGTAIQTITSGGLWGIESDSEEPYLESVEKEELADLRAQLKALGFSSRAISTAFKNVEREGE